jgi:hypothetical protein
MSLSKLILVSYYLCWKIKGQEIELRHIIDSFSIWRAQTAAREKISLIRNKIIAKITFAEAARTESDQN